MLSLKPATEKDFLTIEQLAKAIWHKHYVPIVGIEQVNYMLAKLYHHAALLQQTHEGQQFYLIVNNEEEIGFVSISDKGNQDFFLHKFYILQKNQNTGLGTQVFKKVFEELYKPKTVRLTVNRQNYKSINFYFKLGFKIEKVADFDIGDGYFMNDFVMVYTPKTN